MRKQPDVKTIFENIVSSADQEPYPLSPVVAFAQGEANAVRLVERLDEALTAEESKAGIGH
jgi:hypothetical protein